MSATTTTSAERSMELARRLSDCCEDHTPSEVIVALSMVLASAAASMARHSAELSKVLGLVQHRAYDGAMRLITERPARH